MTNSGNRKMLHVKQKIVSKIDRGEKIEALMFPLFCFVTFYIWKVIKRDVLWNYMISLHGMIFEEPMRYAYIDMFRRYCLVNNLGTNSCLNSHYCEAKPAAKGKKNNH